LPFLIIGGLLFLMTGGLAAAARSKPMSFGRSKAKLYDRSKENSVTFQHVAGVDEAKAELAEVISYLKDPEKYKSVGAHVPKGVLLVGPPGTGKTLLARAVAGESGAPFFSLSGSEFVEMFVGVGAARVRDLFEQAKERAPCIVFIDELDAIGKTRAGATGFVSNEEREQTLNQLLVEMDGFDSGAGLIIMAATNRPEILDKALLRAGRFDRQVVVDRPDKRGRDAILRVHAAKVKLGPDVDLAVVAQRTPGMVGADLENVVNEAALASIRRHAEAVGMQDFEEAVDRIQLGLKKEGRVMTPDERRRVAYHETGHALVALSVEFADPVHRVTIIPRSVGALGATLQLPTDERYLVTRRELLDQLCVLMGGRAAEEVAAGDISTGAQNDLERATEIARQMVTRFGMSDRIGPQTLGRPDGLRFLAAPELGGERLHGEDTARLIDAEVKLLLEQALSRARRIVSGNRDKLERFAAKLLEKESLDRPEIEAILGEGAGDGLARAPAESSRLTPALS
jgi:cell division protease FtsH